MFLFVSYFLCSFLPYEILLKVNMTFTQCNINSVIRFSKLCEVRFRYIYELKTRGSIFLPEKLDILPVNLRPIELLYSLSLNTVAGTLLVLLVVSIKI